MGRIGWVSQAASHLPKHVRISVRELVSLGTLSAKTAFCLTDQDRVRKAIQMVDLEDVQDVDVSISPFRARGSVQ